MVSNGFLRRDDWVSIPLDSIERCLILYYNNKEKMDGLEYLEAFMRNLLKCKDIGRIPYDVRVEIEKAYFGKRIDAEQGKNMIINPPAQAL